MAYHCWLYFQLFIICINNIIPHSKYYIHQRQACWADWPVCGGVHTCQEAHVHAPRPAQPGHAGAVPADGAACARVAGGAAGPLVGGSSPGVHHYITTQVRWTVICHSLAKSFVFLVSMIKLDCLLSSMWLILTKYLLYQGKLFITQFHENHEKEALYCTVNE